jgi:hypothetical protein
VVFSDKITTVSPTYGKEILTPAYGFGFDGIIRDRVRDLSASSTASIPDALSALITIGWDPKKPDGTSFTLPLRVNLRRHDPFSSHQGGSRVARHASDRPPPPGPLFGFFLSALVDYGPPIYKSRRYVSAV